MDTKQEKKFSILVMVGLGIFLFWFVLPAAIRNPHCDSGIFIYCGSRALAGDVPYIDFWDHKGPLIFYINALAALAFATHDDRFDAVAIRFLARRVYILLADLEACLRICSGTGCNSLRSAAA